MLLLQLFENASPAKARARIEHPEDMIFDGGARGAQQAMTILSQTAADPQQVSVKLDGSPSLIMGWRDGEFILTDKAGFTAKSYNGFTTSSDAIENMIMSRKQKDTSPAARAARQQYASKIASLYPLLRKLVPSSFEGFAQGDLMWTSTPPLIDGSYQFQPNKVVYRVPANSLLGQKIGRSQVGIAIHSVYRSPEDSEPTALRNLKSLGFDHTDQVVIVPHELLIEENLVLQQPLFDDTKKLLASNYAGIEEFFDSRALASLEIKSLPGLMKSFLAWKAGEGSSDLSNAPEQFLEWVASGSSGVKPAMAGRIEQWVSDHLDAYNAIWQWVAQIVELKMNLKAQIDSEAKGTIDARLRDANEHEGFVSATPQGLVKLVNRSKFMKKDTTALKEATEDAGPRVVWTFGRMNPPTRGHQHLVYEVEKEAAGDDYWVFLSHSQDSKKNPLDWRTKLNFVREIMPEYADHIIDEDGIKTPIAAANWLYQQGYRNLVMVVGGDRVDAMTELLKGWNSEPVRNKDGRQAVEISVVSAGDRDPDAEGLEGISGSKARQAVANSDLEDFEDKTGLTGELAKRLFDATSQGMQKKSRKSAVEEAWFRRKPPPAQPNDPSKPTPPATKDPRQLAQWIKSEIARSERRGEDPAYLIKINNWENLWWPIMRQVDGDTVAEIRRILHNDPATRDLMQRAAWTEHPRDIRESADHSAGTIVTLSLSESSAQQLSRWCQERGISTIDPKDFHLTVLFSERPRSAFSGLHNTATRVPAQPVRWQLLGSNSLALIVDCPLAHRLHDRLLSLGGTHTYPQLLPHVTIEYGYPGTELPSDTPGFSLTFDQIHAEGIDPDYALKRKA